MLHKAHANAYCSYSKNGEDFTNCYGLDLLWFYCVKWHESFQTMC